MKILTRLALLLPVAVFAACGTDTYDTGDGALSRMQADFVEARTDAYSNMVSIETDDGARFELEPPVALEWASKPDTVYRALFYYNPNTDAQGATTAEPLAVQQVLVPEIIDAAYVEGGIKTDPVTLETAWESANGKYINLGLQIKTGTTDGKQDPQTIGIVHEGTDTQTDGSKLIRLRLYHDQAGVPEYYSAGTYVSIALSRLPTGLTEGDAVSIEVETYDGTVVKTFEI